MPNGVAGGGACAFMNVRRWRDAGACRTAEGIHRRGRLSFFLESQVRGRRPGYVVVSLQSGEPMSPISDDHASSEFPSETEPGGNLSGALQAGSEPQARFAQAILKPRKALPFFARHPWVFDSAIDRWIGNPADGDVVDLLSDKGKFIARGIVNSRSRLRVRLYTWSASEMLERDFFQQRLSAAIGLRRELGLLAAGRACRVVFSEADGLSGLIVDAYDGYLVVQFHARAIAQRAQWIYDLLIQLLKPKGILLRMEKGISQEEGLDPQQGPVWGQVPDGPVLVEEHGLRFGVDLLVGQKTGFYLDQSENRLAAARYLAHRRVLDLFCYSGGFSLVAARHGQAREVLGIDTSDKAILLARANAELNRVKGVSFQQKDCFEALDELSAAGARFGAVILDPPKFTRSRQSIDEALRAYFRINRVAVDLLEPGGILVTCSCSGSITREDFRAMLAGVAQKSGRDLQILEQRGASPDHPIRATCPETEYLKCLICRV